MITAAQQKYKREYYIKNREKILRNRKELYHDLRVSGKNSSYSRTYRVGIPGRANTMFFSARRRAEKRGMEFSITRTWIRDKLTIGLCELTQLKFDMSLGGGSGLTNPFSPSIDRINSKLGYTPENCRMILTAMNTALGMWGDDIFADIAVAYLSFRNKKLAA